VVGLVEGEPVLVRVERLGDEAAVREAGVDGLAEDDELARGERIRALAEVEAEVSIVAACPEEEQLVVDLLRGSAFGRGREREIDAVLETMRSEGAADDPVIAREEREQVVRAGIGQEGAEGLFGEDRGAGARGLAGLARLAASREGEGEGRAVEGAPHAGGSITAAGG
jgi:hypothetical protein